MRKLPPLPAVRVFEAAARHENFTRAAAELGMTQAAVSYQIRLLEERLGVQLFTRDRKRVRLTDSARRIAPQISSAFDTLAAGFSEMQADNDDLLAITTTYTFASNWLALRLGGFQVRRPELAVRLRTDNRLIDFASEEIDLAIRTGKGGWKGLQQHFLFNFYSTPMCSPEFVREHRLRDPADVLRVPRMGAGDPWWSRWLERAGIDEPALPGSSGFSFDSQVSEGNAAIAGHAIAMLSPNFWQGELASGRLVAPFPIISFDGFSYWLVYPEHKRNQPKIRAFREWLLAEIATDAEKGPSEVFSTPAYEETG